MNVSASDAMADAAAVTMARTAHSRDGPERPGPLGAGLEPVFRLLSKNGTPAVAAQAAGMAVRGTLMVVRSLANHQLPATKAGSNAYRPTVTATAVTNNSNATSIRRDLSLKDAVIHAAAIHAPAERTDSSRSTASSCEVFTAAGAQAVLGDVEASEEAALGGSGWGLRAAALARLNNQ